MQTNTEKDNRLMVLFGQLAVAVLQRGLDHARVDDPGSLTVAARMLQTPGARFELRVVLDAEQSSRTSGYVVDDEGADLARVFEITARPDPAQH